MDNFEGLLVNLLGISMIKCTYNYKNTGCTGYCRNLAGEVFKRAGEHIDTFKTEKKVKDETVMLYCYNHIAQNSPYHGSRTMITKAVGYA